MSERAVALLRRVEETGGALKVDGADLLFIPGDPSTADALTNDLRAHKPEILALLQPCADDPDTWRAPFVKWIDANCVPFERASCGLAVLHRLYRAQAGPLCTRDMFRAMLAELCFPIRTVGGVELIDGLILKDDLQAIMVEHGMKAGDR